MPRTAGQRRADALMAIFEAAATAGIDGVPLEVVLNLVMDHDQFEQYTRQQLDATPVAIDPATVRDRRCETVDGVPVDPRQAVALALLGHVRRIVVDGAGVVVNAGRLRRLFTGPLRDILQVIEPRCIWLGCTIRAAISKSITFTVTPTADQPTPPTPVSCANTTTCSSTAPATTPGATTTASGTSPAPTAHPSNHPPPPDRHSPSNGNQPTARTARTEHAGDRSQAQRTDAPRDRPVY